MDAAKRRLESIRTLLTLARERLEITFGFVLWDGSSVPHDLAPDALAVAIADEGAVAALIRKPKLDTLGNLWVSGRIDIRNGSFLDLVARRPKIRTKQLLKALDKGLVLRTAARFLFVGRGGPWPLEDIADGKTPDEASGAERKENVAYHYDVSNAFYALFLDSEMVYTCAYFKEPDNDIETAQHDKLDMICRKLRLKSGETLLDLGCGWGALSCFAAQNYGVYARGVTLAEEQYTYARDKAARLGLGDRAVFEHGDYAKVEGSYDKVAAIGLLEHVGLANYPAFYQRINRLLKPGGIYLHHAIARPAKRDDRKFRRRAPEYAAIIKYIFPGGELDHIGMSVSNLERYGFEVHDVEGWREHYARTCRIWHDRLYANRDAAVREVGSVKTRMWLVYLAGCALAFERNTVGIFQTVASKRVRGPSALPLTRADLYR